MKLILMISATLLMITLSSCAENKSGGSEPAAIGKCYPYQPGVINCVIQNTSCYIYNNGNSVVCRQFSQQQ